MKTLWKNYIFRKLLIRLSLNFHPFWGNMNMISTFESTGSDQKLKSYRLLEVLNTLPVFSYLGETDYDKNPYVS